MAKTTLPNGGVPPDGKPKNTPIVKTASTVAKTPIPTRPAQPKAGSKKT